MTIKGLHHVAIICRDYNVSKNFYTQILGGQIVGEHWRQEKESYKLDLHFGAINPFFIELFSFPHPPKRPSYPEAAGLRHMAFAVDDVEHWHRHLSQQGVLVEPIRLDEYTNKSFFFCQDPDGLPLEFYQSK